MCILLPYAVLSDMRSTACSMLLLYRMYCTVFWWYFTLLWYPICILLHAEDTYGDHKHHMYMYCMQNINTVLLYVSAAYLTACSILLLCRMRNYNSRILHAEITAFGWHSIEFCYHECIRLHATYTYGVAMIRRLLKIRALFCRISSLL